MNPVLNPVESSLRRVAARWKWCRFIEYTALLGSVVCGVCMLLALGMIRWFENSLSVVVSFVILSIGAALAWLGLLLRIRGQKLDRAVLAGLIEGSDPRLLDRLNTLVHLQTKPHSDQAVWFLPQIFRQSQRLLKEQKPVRPFSVKRPLIYLGVFGALLAATIYIFQRYAPWERLRMADELRLAKNRKTPDAAELALPTNGVAEEQKAWGEVRITNPAHDMKVTKVDVVPLQIEAAANDALKNVGWYSTINGADEKPHALPPPAEPRYAVYQPLLYLDELQLADWDVLTYYANAHTEHGRAYASEVYFLEVRPFREDLLKMPGGEGGKAYEALSQMTDLIERQQHVIRQTHQYQQTPDVETRLREQDRHKLSGAEEDLKDSVEHLYAKMAAEMENEPIGEALDNFAHAGLVLASASKAIEDDTMTEAQNQERSALTYLIAARKMFQKAISDHPEKFGDGKNDDSEPEPLPDAMKQLGDIAEFRNEAKVAQEFVQKTIDQQRALVDKAVRATAAQRAQFGTNEGNLAKSLEDFALQHPHEFQAVTNATAEATRSLEKAGDLLRKKSKANSEMENAADKLEALQGAMKSHATGRELSDAYKLKGLLDKQIRALEEFQKATNAIARTNLQRAAAESKETLNELKQVADSKSAGRAFGPSLRDSLSGPSKSSLDAQLDQLAQAQSAGEQHQGEAAAAHGLERVSKAFTESEPSAMQASQRRDALKPDGQESFDQGMQQLESLKQDLENDHQIPDEKEAELRSEALLNLKNGLLELQGKDESARLIVLLESELKHPMGRIDLKALKKLMDELRDFSVEVADKQTKSDNPEITNIDPSRLPATYRGRIQKYYQKLSDQKP